MAKEQKRWLVKEIHSYIGMVTMPFNVYKVAFFQIKKFKILLSIYQIQWKKTIVAYKAYVARREAEEEDAKGEGNDSENDFYTAQTALANTRQGFEDEKKYNNQSESSKVVSSGAYFEQKKNEQIEVDNDPTDSEDKQINIETAAGDKVDFEEEKQELDKGDTQNKDTTQKESEALDLAQKTMEEMKKRREKRKRANINARRRKRKNRVFKNRSNRRRPCYYK